MVSASHGIVGLLQQDFLLTPNGRSHVNLLGGSAAYASAGARLWSDSVAVLARIGSNFPADLLAQLEQVGISVEGVRRLDEAIDHRRFLAYLALEERSTSHPTSHYLRTGNRFPKELIGYAPPSDSPTSQSTQTPQAYRPDDLTSTGVRADAAHLCPVDYLTHMLLPRALRDRGTRVITLDPNPQTLDPARPELLRELICGVDAFLPSEEEAERAFRPPRPGLWEMAEAFAEMGCRFVVIKRGAGGQCVWDQDARRRWQVPAYPSHARDLTGAGDAFCGGFLVGLARTGDVLEATLRGNVSASMAIEGTGPLHPLDATPGLAEARLAALRERVRPA